MVQIQLRSCLEQPLYNDEASNSYGLGNEVYGRGILLAIKSTGIDDGKENGQKQENDFQYQHGLAPLLLQGP